VVLVVKAPAEAPDALFHTPDGISDEVASTLAVAGTTAAAALAAIGLRSGDTVLIGGAAGGVGVFAVQLAKLAGATVIGTAAEGTLSSSSGSSVPSPWRTAPGWRTGYGHWLSTE
jgi:NADPH:quinone reductase-like Zn-dependent oxidoreductase